MKPPEIHHDWNRVQFVSFGKVPWTREAIVDFILEIEERVARGGTHDSAMKPRLSLVKKPVDELPPCDCDGFEEYTHYSWCSRVQKKTDG